VHVNRTANNAAHSCAQAASTSVAQCWANVMPNFLLPALQDDRNIASEWIKKQFSKKMKQLTPPPLACVARWL
jgi:hypothetical protein